MEVDEGCIQARNTSFDKSFATFFNMALVTQGVEILLVVSVFIVSG